jgi:16S rRNA (cytosine967-C5)-methyltransferase
LARTRWAPGAPALAAAANAVDEVVSRGRSADAVLSGGEGAQRAAVQAVTLGAVRWYLRLRPAIDALLRWPAELPGPVHALLVVAAHQVEYSRNAPQASVHAAVDAARILGAQRAASLVNAVLRRFVAERTALLARVDEILAQRTAHPAWLTARILRAWPGEGAAILAANNAHPPMTVRVDTSRIDVPTYLVRLAEASIDAQEVQSIPSAVTLNRPMPVAGLPGFTEGLVSVQDAGAQLAGTLLQVAPGMRVLDACAAPGGKTAHLLELMGEGADVTAVDIDGGRVSLIEENLSRLNRRARVVVGDARAPGDFWDGTPYERILVDAPCSATGVIRRHPDIKLLRRESDIAPFAALQLQILQAAVGMLAVGGRLLYSTCSVLPQENEEVIARLLGAAPHMSCLPMPLDGGLAPPLLPRPAGAQLLPGSEAGTDGFYYACLEKTTAGT